MNAGEARGAESRRALQGCWTWGGQSPQPLSPELPHSNASVGGPGGLDQTPARARGAIQGGRLPRPGWNSLVCQTVVTLCTARVLGGNEAPSAVLGTGAPFCASRGGDPEFRGGHPALSGCTGAKFLMEPEEAAGGRGARSLEQPGSPAQGARGRTGPPGWVLSLRLPASSARGRAPRGGQTSRSPAARVPRRADVNSFLPGAKERPPPPLGSRAAGAGGGSGTWAERSVPVPPAPPRPPGLLAAGSHPGLDGRCRAPGPEATSPVARGPGRGRALAGSAHLH